MFVFFFHYLQEQRLSGGTVSTTLFCLIFEGNPTVFNPVAGIKNNCILHYIFLFVYGTQTSEFFHEM